MAQGVMRQTDSSSFIWWWWPLLALIASSLVTSHQVHSRQKGLQLHLSASHVRAFGTLRSFSFQSGIGIVAVKGKLLRLKMDLSEEALHPGDGLFIEGVFNAPSERRNPYDFDEERYFQSQRWLGIIIPSRITVDHTTHASRPAYLLHRLRAWFQHRIDTQISSPTNRHLLQALLLGDRSELENEIIHSFRRTGLSHILAISGLHVGMIAGMVHFVIGVIFLRLPIRLAPKRWSSATVSIVLVWIFAAMVGLTASVFRACIMVSLFLISTAFQRKMPLVRTLGIAFFIVILVRPSDLFSPGFQLSFMAVGFICLGLDNQSRSRTNHPLLFYVLSAMKMTVAASIGTAPVLSYYFGFVPLGSILFSPLIVPLISFVLPLSLAALLLPTPGGALAIMAELGLDVMIWISTYGARANWIPSWNGPIYTIPPLILASILVFLLWKTGKKNLYRRVWLGSFLLLSTSDIAASSVPVKITVLDAGQGDAIVIEAPSKQSLVLDTGPGRRSGKSVYNHLKAQGLLSDYRVLLSHAHADHTGGLSFLIEESRSLNVEPSGVLHGGWLHSQSRDVHLLRRGSTLDFGDDIRLYVLGPESEGGDNDHSIILLLQYGHSQMLFMGDSERVAEQKMIARYQPLLKPDVLKAGHHGSRTSTSLGLINVINPKITIISAGLNNRFGHPHAEIVERLEKAGSDVRQTNMEGAIQIQMDGYSTSIIPWKAEY